MKEQHISSPALATYFAIVKHAAILLFVTVGF